MGFEPFSRSVKTSPYESRGAEGSTPFTSPDGVTVGVRATHTQLGTGGGGLWLESGAGRCVCRV